MRFVGDCPGRGGERLEGAAERGERWRMSRGGQEVLMREDKERGVGSDDERERGDVKRGHRKSGGDGKKGCEEGKTSGEEKQNPNHLPTPINLNRASISRLPLIHSSTRTPVYLPLSLSLSHAHTHIDTLPLSRRIISLRPRAGQARPSQPLLILTVPPQPNWPHLFAEFSLLSDLFLGQGAGE
jgi:hypothetical protein